MNPFRPAVALLLLQGPTGEGKPYLVEVITPHAEISAPDHDGRFFHQQLIFLFCQFSAHAHIHFRLSGILTSYNSTCVARYPSVCMKSNHTHEGQSHDLPQK